MCALYKQGKSQVMDLVVFEHLAKESIQETETLMKKSVENLKEILVADGKIPDNDGCYHIAVTLDGT